MFRKRRIKPSPNKNAAKVRRRESDVDQPSLSSIYPSVDRLAIELRFFNNQGNPLGEKSLHFSPTDPLELEVACSGLCGDGRMDLAGKVDDMIQRRIPSSQAAGKCSQRLFAGSPDACGHELRCRIEINYKPEAVSAA